MISSSINKIKTWSKETPDINVRPLQTQVQQTHTYMEGKNLGPNPGSNSVQLCEVHKVIDLLYDFSNYHVILKDTWYSIMLNKYNKGRGTTQCPACSAAAVTSYITSPEEQCPSSLPWSPGKKVPRNLLSFPTEACPISRSAYNNMWDQQGEYKQLSWPAEATGFWS